MDPAEVKLTAADELRCIFRIALPTKLSSCDIRVSHFNPTARETEDRPRISILHVSGVGRRLKRSIVFGIIYPFSLPDSLFLS